MLTMPCSWNTYVGILNVKEFASYQHLYLVYVHFYDPYSSFLNYQILHYLSSYNSQAHDTIAIDKKVCFYRRHFANPIKSHRTNTDPVELLKCINRVAYGFKLFLSTSALLMVRSRRLYATSCPTVHTYNLVACVWEHH